jgi:WD40 repeat protein
MWQIWRTDTLWRSHQGVITDLKWSPVDDRLASVDSNGNVRVWNAVSTTAWRLCPPAAQSRDWVFQGYNWSSDGRYMAMAGGDPLGSTPPPSFNIWDVQENTLLMENLGDALNLVGLEAHFASDDQAILYLGLERFPDLPEIATADALDAKSGQIGARHFGGASHLLPNPSALAAVKYLRPIRG